ncbi:histidine kinase [Saccharopolyspora hirsuta]|uniref:sensor histidine kinase n=1 Tax=Saccharopolyspora hirsuta TaxID=1837 RepID=UPI0014793C84|nr:histidine kinase [Saccharopolyspora hirsuta]
MVSNGEDVAGGRLRRLVHEARPVALQLAVFAGSFLPLGPSIAFPGWEPMGAPKLAVCAVIGVASALAVRMRPRRTWPLFAIALVSWLAVSAWPALCVASYTAAAVFQRTSRLLAYVVVASLSAALPGVVAIAADLPRANWSLESSLGAAALFVGLPLMVGLWSAARRQVVRGLRERAEQLELSQAAKQEQARLQERSRIAREMHDVVAHRVTLMVLHAGAIEVNAQDGEVVREAALIRSTGREALAQLREVLGVLRASQPPAEPVAQPNLEAVQAMVRRSRSAGLDIGIRHEGELSDLPVMVQHTAYRVVQEALTNAHKHAGSARTEVLLRRRDGELLVEVHNAAPRERTAPIPGSGLGLVGLRERVELLGGRFHAAPGFDGGFTVSARIPLDAAD